MKIVIDKDNNLNKYQVNSDIMIKKVSKNKK